MFSSITEFFGSEKKLQHLKNERSSSLKGSLPTILFATTCIDFEPLSPLTTTDPINVPLTHYCSSKSYNSSLDSQSIGKNNSLTSSVSSLSSSSSYGHSMTHFSSSKSDDDDDTLSLAFVTPPPTAINSSSTDPLSAGDMNDAYGAYHLGRVEKAPRILSQSNPPSPPATTIESKIITKFTLFENFRHSLSLFVGPSSTSMSWITPPLLTNTTNNNNMTTTTTTPTTTSSVYDNVFYEEEDCAITVKPKHDHHHHHYPQQPIYTRALRENPDHLRMIVSEVNMMRVNKLISPLRPRAILLERTDPFIPSTPSPLRNTIY
ncbi:hypothetical protein BCR42DRAFT_406520 [Absidia repens]|uniref:Uncharacterized protein n=1 Tax=Absidia repens TaxID=90262 RepID=A0A1X2IUW4_9FUNG|nr:hypothetical protein BCR42DRAFT_406520 [Absidia repens]